MIVFMQASEVDEYLIALSVFWFYQRYDFFEEWKWAPNQQNWRIDQATCFS